MRNSRVQVQDASLKDLHAAVEGLNQRLAALEDIVPRVRIDNSPGSPQSRDAGRTIFRVTTRFGFSSSYSFTLQQLIRDHATALFRACGNGHPVAAKKADIDKLSNNPDSILGPSTHSFSVDMNVHARRSSAWNKKAARVFTESFRKAWPEYHVEQVQRAFFTHLQTIQRHYHQAVDGVSETQLLAQKKIRIENRQRRVCTHLPAYLAVLTIPFRSGSAES